MTKPKWKIIKSNRRSIYVKKESEYCQVYLKGRVVRAHKDSFGLFCFNHKHQAITFLNNYSPTTNTSFFKIIKIIPLSKGKRPNMVFLSRSLKRAYKSYLKNDHSYFYAIFSVPAGTICYDKIKVLE